MPEATIKARGGAKRWRTIELGNGEYAHVAVTRRKGPRGGSTVMGKVRTKKDYKVFGSDAEVLAYIKKQIHSTWKKQNKEAKKYA
jgi:hypothetical protein